MAREATPKPGHNSLADKGMDFVKRIETLNADIEREKESIAENIASIKKDIKQVMKEAKSAGLKAAVSAKVAERKALKKADEARNRLDIADRDTFDNIALRLGDLRETPLGSSALLRAASAFGDVVDLTDEEKAKGMIVAFVDKEGNRSALGIGAKESA